MARIRSIKPEFAKSEAIAILPRDVRLHFALLWTYADDDGRGVDNPKLIKAELWPLDDDVDAGLVEHWQSVLAAHGRIRRYEIDGKRFFEIVNFTEHQKPQKKTDSKLPPPSSAAAIEPLREESRSAAVEVAPVVVVVDGGGEVDGDGAAASAEPKASKPKRRLPDDFTVTDPMRAWACEHAPLCNVNRETDQFRDYHAAKGDTARDWDASWRNWLRKAQTFAEERGSSFRPPRPTNHDRNMDILEDFLEDEGVLPR